MNIESRRGQSHIKGMDGLRALGVLMVLISHLWPRPGPVYDYFHFGRVGVILFFVISGFLVTRSLLDLRHKVTQGCMTRSSAMLTFYYRRVLRIFPLYYLALAYLYWIAQDPHVREHVIWLLTYTSNYSFFFDISFGNADHFWTLAIEEQFYLIIPLFVIALSIKRSKKWIIALLIAGLIIKIFTAYSYLMRGGFYVWNYATHPLWGSLEGLCLGSLLAYNASRTAWVGEKRALLSGVILLTGASVYYSILGNGINQDLIYTSLSHLCIAAFSLTLVAHVIHNPSGTSVKILEWGPLRWMGRISYGIYVIHYIVRPDGSAWVDKYHALFPDIVQPYLLFILVSTFSIVVASLSYIMIERPLMSLKKFYPVSEPNHLKSNIEKVI